MYTQCNKTGEFHLSDRMRSQRSPIRKRDGCSDARPAGATGSRAGNRSTSGEEWREEGPRECREAVVVTGACSQAKLLQAELDPGPGSLTRPVTVPQLLQVTYYLLGRPVLRLSRPGSRPRPAGSPQPMTNMGVKMPDADRRRGNSGMAAIQLARLHPGRPLPGLSPPLLSSTCTGSFSFGSNRGHGLSHVRLVSVTTTVCTLSLSPSIKEEKRENLVLHGRKARCSLS